MLHLVTAAVCSTLSVQFHLTVFRCIVRWAYSTVLTYFAVIPSSGQLAEVIAFCILTKLMLNLKSICWLQHIRFAWPFLHICIYSTKCASKEIHTYLFSVLFVPVCGFLSYFIALVSVVLERVTERCQLSVFYREIGSSCMMWVCIGCAENLNY